MNVSFDGLRTNATRSMNRLYDTIKDIVESGEYHTLTIDEKAELIEKFNEAAQYVDVFNCLYDDKVEDDFNSMDDLSIDRLDDLEEDGV